MLRPLRRTPLHPQWHVERQAKWLARYIRQHTAGIVLDIGCADMAIRRELDTERHYYIGLDYPATAEGWYRTRPHVFGDGQRLPIRSDTIDVLLLANVLEHLPNPRACLAEVERVLSKGGICIAEVPFLYPIHDAPLDFTRWTSFGLENLFRKQRLAVDSVVPLGSPTETAALLFNLALSERFMRLLANRNPFAILLPLLPIIFIALNVISYLLARIWRSDFMPYGYRIMATKRTG
jgi:SAM-dependent methyltransferase